MKIEKVNDHQIRCTLTKQDLASRHLKLSELAYGTEKAKMLFQDMMQQASYEFGFESDDIPLMIEAIPTAAGTMILNITKVEYPEELDTRFSKFSDLPEEYDSYMDDDYQDVFSEGADDIIDLFKKITEKKETPSSNFVSLREAFDSDSDEHASVPIDLTKMFIFHNLTDVLRLSRILKDLYDGDNSLFKDESCHTYYLILHKSSLSPEIFNRVCNILAEYAHQGIITAATEAYLTEHHHILCQHNALQTFASF